MCISLSYMTSIYSIYIEIHCLYLDKESTVRKIIAILYSRTELLDIFTSIGKLAIYHTKI